MKCFSLFSGVGGFDLALTNLGHEIVGACEIDDHARRVYERHFSGVQIWPDATKIHPEELPDFELLCGGFPCQSFSIAGKRLGLNESRGTLFYEIVRIAEQKRPRFIFLENVRGLLNHDKGRTFTIIAKTFDELGYDIEWQVINSKYFVPQNRERIFIIGHLRGSGRRKIFPIGEYNETLGRETQDRQKCTAIDSNYWKGLDNHGQRTMVQVGNIDTKGHNSIWGRVYDTEGIAPTINAEGGGLGAKTGLIALSHTKANMKQRYQTRDTTWSLDTSGGKMAVEVEDNRKFLVPDNWSHIAGEPETRKRHESNIHPALQARAGGTQQTYLKEGMRIRRLTPKECERLQGFPDDWTSGQSDTQRYKQLGNAVTVPVIEYIASKL